MTPLFVAALFLTGCSDPSVEAAAEPASPADWPAVDTPLDGVELTLWTAESTASVPAGVAAAFEELTGATVNLTVVPDQYEANAKTKLATGAKPDLMFWETNVSVLNTIQAEENLQPLDGAPWFELLDADSQRLGVKDDVHYGAIIKSYEVMGVYYNLNNFEKAGITDVPHSWDELAAAAQKLKDAGVEAPFYEAAGDQWPVQWGAQMSLADLSADGFYGDLNTAQASFSDAAVVDRLTAFTDLYAEDGMANSNIKTATFADQGAALMSGEAGMEFHVNAIVDQLSQAYSLEEIDETVGFFPISPEGNNGTMSGGQANSLVAYRTGDETREAAARQFLTFWLTDYYPTFIEEMGYVSIQPAVASPAGIPQATLDSTPAGAAEKFGSTAVASMQMEAINNPDLYLNMAEVLQGAKTPQEAADATQAQFEQLARAAGVAGF